MNHIVNLREIKKNTEKLPKKPEKSTNTVLETKILLDSPSLFQWEAPSFYYNPQKKYLVLTVIILIVGASILLFYGGDILLAIFLLLSSLVLVLYANKKPVISKVSVDQNGVSVNDHAYYYEDLKSFWINYIPNGPKEISLESKKWYLPHVKISLEKENPIEIRSFMIKFIPEKIHEQSLADYVAQKLGI